MLRRTEKSFYEVDVTIRISDYDMSHILFIKEKAGAISAMKTIRMLVPQLTLTQAKNIVEEL